MLQNKEKTLLTLKNIFNDKDNLEIELSLSSPILITMSDVMEFVDLFYEKNIFPEITLLFTVEVFSHGGISAEFDAYQDITKGTEYYAFTEINISNEKKFSFSFFLAKNKNSIDDILLDTCLETNDVVFFVDSFLKEYDKIKEFTKNIINQTKLNKNSIN